MIELSSQDVMCVAGAGWGSFLIPIAIGFVTGGPVGALVGVGGVIAVAGTKNIEHLHRTGEIPTINEIVNR